MPRVSVIIPSYNHEKYVAEAIQSVLDQSFQDFEIVITDDGSTDGTITEIKKFKDPRIRLFPFKENKGACVAVRKCLDEAKGEYIAMLSSDDVFLPGKLEKQVRFLDERTDIWAVFGYAQVIDEVGNDFEEKNHIYCKIFKQPNRNRFEWLNHFFYNGNCLCHPSALIRRSLYDELGYYDERLAQLPDFDMWIRTCLKHEIYIMPENLIKFRVRAGELNASGNRSEVHKRTGFELTRVLRHYLELRSTDEMLKVFPGAEKYGKEDKDLIPYFVARLAFDNEKSFPLNQVFAINVLYDILGDGKMAAKLEKKCAFTYRDFIELTGLDYSNLEVFRRFRISEQESQGNAAYQDIQPLINDGKNTEAISRLKELLKTYPDYAVAHNDLGVLYFNKGDKEKALTHFTKAIQLQPEDAGIQKNVAYFSYAGLGNVEDAVKLYMKILAEYPKDLETLLALGQICTDLSHFEDARIFFNKVIELEPDNQVALENLKAA